jgi:hypothetical protein
MGGKKKRNPSWPDVETLLERLGKKDLIGLISDIYQLSKGNKDFFHARFAIGDSPIGPYKKIIKECMYPDPIYDKPIQISRAKQAISDYSSAVSDAKGEADLMTYFVECGNRFTVESGDIDEDFYDALLEIYNLALNKVLALPRSEQGDFRKRLKKIMLSTNGIGWGYHDGLCDEYYEAFQDDE